MLSHDMEYITAMQSSLPWKLGTKPFIVPIVNLYLYTARRKDS